MFNRFLNSLNYLNFNFQLYFYSVDLRKTTIKQRILKNEICYMFEFDFFELF